MPKTIPTDTHITYQQQYRRCGKPSCGSCKSGQKHGPYIYGYARVDGKVRSYYIGKMLPEAERKVKGE